MIARHNGKATSAWLVVLIAESEANARAIYNAYQNVLTRGAVRLYNPDGDIALQHVAFQEKAR